MHIVQISYDDSVFAERAPSDTRARQTGYGDYLVRRRPGSRLTFLALTGRADAHAFSAGPVRFQPVAGRGPLRWLRLFLTLLGLERPDVIAAQTIFFDAWVALAAGGLRRVPVVGQIHFDLYAPEAQAENLGPGWAGRWRLAAGLRLMRRLRAVRVVGRRLKDRLLAEGRHSRIAVIPVPVTFVPAAPAPAEARVLFVGRLAAQKNLAGWLAVAERVAAQVPAARFEWAGAGPLQDELWDLARQHGLQDRLTLLGAVPYADLPAVYGRAAVLLLTSHYEGFGRVLVEAGLAGVPAVAPRLTGVEDIIVDGETGYLHAPGDLAGLAGSVVELLGDPGRRAAMGAAAARRVRAVFDPQALGQAWIDQLIAAAEAQP